MKALHHRVTWLISRTSWGIFFDRIIVIASPSKYGSRHVERSCFPQSLTGNGHRQHALRPQSKKWVDTSLCQLCSASPGTLMHRHHCPVLQPVAGWQAPPTRCQAMANKISEPCLHLLRTRGLFTVKVALHPCPAGDSFDWMVQLSDIGPATLIWVIDGSLYDEPRRIARRIGFGIEVVSADVILLALNMGVLRHHPMTPTRHHAAGAEAWAYVVITRDNHEPPCTVTGCKGVLDTLEAGAQAATLPSKRLARLWRMTAANLDGSFGLATRMPAHGAAHTIGVARDSHRQPISA